MMNETVINEMNECANELREKANHEFGNQLRYEVSNGEYDRTRTSYIINIDAFGFDLQVVYVFDDETVYVYDATTDRNVMKCDVSGSFDMSEMFDFGIWYYSMILHTADSTTNFEVM